MTNLETLAQEVHTRTILFGIVLIGQCLLLAAHIWLIIRIWRHPDDEEPKS